MTVKLGFYALHEDVIMPEFATKGSACFDLMYQGHGKQEYEGFNKQNKKFVRPLSKGQVYVGPGERVMVPTGLIMNIPKGYSVRIHPRSGVSLKAGLILCNNEAVIDSDYVEECFLLVYNRSSIGHALTSGDRIAQGELVKNEEYSLTQSKDKPKQKTERAGGMGSTGVKSESKKRKKE